MKPHFHFITLFPQTIEVWLTTSILGRAYRSGLFDFTLYQLRDFTTDKHRAVDDVAYGGGGGMVLQVEPLVNAVETIRKQIGNHQSATIYFSPAGTPIQSQVLEDLAPSETRHHYIFICGHYEGIDQRFIDHWVDRELSLGDFVITGGELPAVAFTDALVRRLDGALGSPGASDSESFSLVDPKTNNQLLEYPHYTRPVDFRGHKVPEILLSGNHKKIAQWRTDEAVRKTQTRRPDLMTKVD